MAALPKTIEIILEAAADIPTIRARKMLLVTADLLPVPKPKKPRKQR